MNRFQDFTHTNFRRKEFSDKAAKDASRVFTYSSDLFLFAFQQVVGTQDRVVWHSDFWNSRSGTMTAIKQRRAKEKGDQ
jgi:hypothetical protein